MATQSPIHQFYNPLCLLPSVFCPLSSVFCPLHLSRGLYKSHLFMQNKANFLKSQMNVNPYNTTVYENNSNWTLGKNKPKQSQFPKSTNECKLTYNKGLQKKRRFHSPKKQTQFKPNLVRRRRIANERKCCFNKGL